MPITLNGDTGIQTPMYNGTITANAVTPSVNMKNRIINGAMTIDQRNAGASVAVTTSDTYITDRFTAQIFGGAAGRFTAQQVSTAPTGFNNSLQLTVTTAAASPSSGDGYCIQQRIEGYNIADLGFGSASAKTITISFWVRSSVTGSFGLLLNNAALSRTYGVLYTISAANTWEQKSVTIAGDTTGTWGTTNGTGIFVSFALGGGSNRTVSTGWNAYGTGAAPAYVTGGVNLMATNGATFYITGVQLEVGSTATSFDYRPYGTELALCQRYYQQYSSTGDNAGFICNAYNDTTVRAFGVIQFPVIMRTSPSFTSVSAASFGLYGVPANSIALTSMTLLGSASLPSSIGLIFNVASGLTAGQGTVLKDIGSNANGRIQLSSEL